MVERAGMFVYGLAVLLGIMIFQQMTALPSLFFFTVCNVLFFALFIYCFRSPVYKKKSSSNKLITLTFVSILLIYIGFIVASIFAYQFLDEQLSSDLTGKNLIITGRVINLPGNTVNGQRFEFRVDEYRLQSDKKITIENEADSEFMHLSRMNFPKKIRLSWYYGDKVNTDEKWQLLVRLKPPHGFINPGGFDYETWLFTNGITATGYVRKSSLNKRIQSAPKWTANQLRQSLALRIEKSATASLIHSKVTDFLLGWHLDNTSTGVLGDTTLTTIAFVKALAIGDKSSISTQQWEVLTNTGTSHLMAISGLHIGLAALFVSLLIRYSIPAYFLHYFPAQHFALLGGVVGAMLYAIVAGFSIPTQRALIMLLVLSLLLLLRRNHRPLDALGFALVIILLIDPVAVLAVGFWFSFSAVAVIFITANAVSKNDADTNEESNLARAFWLKTKMILKHWIRLQLLITLFLLPLSLFMFKQVSLVAPLANLLLIPYVSFLVVPLVLLAIVFSFVSDIVSATLFESAAFLLALIWPLLSSLAELPFAKWQYGGLGVKSLVLTTVALLLMYFSTGLSQYFSSCVNQKKGRIKHYITHSWSIRGLALGLLACGFLPVLISDKSALKSGEIELTVLDVGQGSAAVIQTKNHTLVFDAGAKFSEKLDTGSNIIMPFLRNKFLTEIDTLVISHGDADHIGGAQSLLDDYPIVNLIGQDISTLKFKNKRLCYAGISWQWDGVDFQFLSPEQGKQLNIEQSKRKNVSMLSNKRNNHSCVLKVSSNVASVLLTGDIENEIERDLVEKLSDQLESDVLIVPHHGSNSSSITSFITAVKPKISIISAGYRNRYNLPNQKVLNRYALLGSRVLQTQSSGGINLIMKADSTIELQQYRELSRKYWHHAIPTN